jgi:hypothetical protein
MHPQSEPHRIHRLLLSHIILGMFTDSLPSNRCPIATWVGSHGNLFTESLPSNGSIHHGIKWQSFSWILNIFVHYVRWLSSSNYISADFLLKEYIVFTLPLLTSEITLTIITTKSYYFLLSSYSLITERGWVAHISNVSPDTHLRQVF